MERDEIAAGLRTPRSAAIAGIVFALILGAVLMLLHSAMSPEASETGEWLSDDDRRVAIERAINLIPFAGIAFLWFIGVIRSRLGNREDRFFATVLLGSGLLFVAMLFSAAAVLDAVIAADSTERPLAADSVRLGYRVAQVMLGTFGARMAAVFSLSLATMVSKTHALPRWLGIPGYVTGLVLLLAPPLPKWAQMLFPAWILAVSIYILVASRRSTGGDGLPAPTA